VTFALLSSLLLSARAEARVSFRCEVLQRNTRVGRCLIVFKPLLLRRRVLHLSLSSEDCFVDLLECFVDLLLSDSITNVSLDGGSPVLSFPNLGFGETQGDSKNRPKTHKFCTLQCPNLPAIGYA